MKYAGIGSRETPLIILDVMQCSAQLLAIKGYTLATGDAKGADQAFAEGAVRGKGTVIHCLPWYSYEKDWRYGLAKHSSSIKVVNIERDIAANKSVDKYHPAPGRLSSAVRKLHARNYLIIEGSDFVVCWTKDGKDTGGTGQGIRIAKDMNIPVYNLYNVEDYAALMLKMFTQTVDK